MARVAPRDDRGPIAPSGPDCTVGPRSGLIAPSGPDRAPIAPSGPDCAVGPRSGRDCAVTRSFALQGGILSNTGGKDGPGRSARILGGCGAVGDIARAYLLSKFFFKMLLLLLKRRRPGWVNDRRRKE